MARKTGARRVLTRDEEVERSYKALLQTRRKNLRTQIKQEKKAASSEQRTIRDQCAKDKLAVDLKIKAIADRATKERDDAKAKCKLYRSKRYPRSTIAAACGAAASKTAGRIGRVTAAVDKLRSGRDRTCQKRKADAQGRHAKRLEKLSGELSNVLEEEGENQRKGREKRKKTYGARDVSARKRGGERAAETREEQINNVPPEWRELFASKYAQFAREAKEAGNKEPWEAFMDWVTTYGGDNEAEAKLELNAAREAAVPSDATFARQQAEALGVSEDEQKAAEKSAKKKRSNTTPATRSSSPSSGKPARMKASKPQRVVLEALWDAGQRGAEGEGLTQAQLEFLTPLSADEVSAALVALEKAGAVEASKATKDGPVLYFARE